MGSNNSEICLNVCYALGGGPAVLINLDKLEEKVCNIIPQEVIQGICGGVELSGIKSSKSDANSHVLASLYNGVSCITLTKFTFKHLPIIENGFKYCIDYLNDKKICSCSSNHLYSLITVLHQ